MMATNETLENQAHETGNESFPNKFINRAGETIDHLADKRQDIGGQQHQNHEKEEINSIVEETNGQPMAVNAMDQSNDTIGTTTTTTSTSTPNSSPQKIQQKSEQLYQNDTAQPREQHDGVSETDRIRSNNEMKRNIGDNEDHDGDDEDEGDDDDLEEGELKDDDDDDDDDEDDNNTPGNRFSSSNDNNNNNNNEGGLTKDSSAYSDSRLQNDSNSQNNPSNYGGPPRPYNHQQHHHNRRHFSPNQPHHPGMHHPQFPPYQHQFPGNNINYRFPPGHESGMPPMMMPHMNHHPAGPGPGPGDMYGPRGPPVNVGPVQKVNIKCRYYSKTINKCTWGEQCRFRHREDSPSMNEGFDDRPPGPEVGLMPGRGPQPPPPMGAADRFYPAPPMPHQPYGYGPPYEHHPPPYGPHQSASPPLPPHSMPPHHWRQQLSPYPASSTSSAHHPESVSPALLPNSGAPPMGPNSGSRVPPSQPTGGSSSAVPPVAPSPGGALSPGYSSSPSSSAVYERKSRLAYESAPWNDRGYPQHARYDRNDPASGYPPPASRGGYYRNHYSRDPYGREPIPPHHGGGGAPYNYPSGYPPNYPSAYRGGPPTGGPPYASHYRYSSSSQRTAPLDARQSKSNKRARDGESSWSDSGSEDSLLNQAGTSSKSHSSKMNKKYHRISTQATNKDPDIDASAAAKDDADQGGSGTPPGEPLTEDKERQELLLEKLREIEDLMAKKKKEEEEEDSL